MQAATIADMGYADGSSNRLEATRYALCSLRVPVSLGARSGDDEAVSESPDAGTRPFSLLGSSATAASDGTASSQRSDQHSPLTPDRIWLHDPHRHDVAEGRAIHLERVAALRAEESGEREQAPLIEVMRKCVVRPACEPQVAEMLPIPLRETH